MKRFVIVALLSVAAGLSLPAVAQPKAPDAQQFVGSPKGSPLAGPLLEEQAHRVSGLLRCPVCQGLSVADSPAEMAVNMKRQVRDLLSRGYTEEQILQYFELSYGQFVLLRPKFQGMNVLVWILPIAALLLGFAIVAAKIKKLSANPVERRPSRPPGESEQDDPYLAQVRDLVGGGKQ